MCNLRNALNIQELHMEKLLGPNFLKNNLKNIDFQNHIKWAILMIKIQVN